MTQRASQDPLPSEPPVSPTGRSSRRRALKYLLLAVVITLAGATYYYAFCNWSFHSREWTSRAIEPAIRKGLDYLYASEAFARAIEDGGEAPPHFFFLELVLRRHDHPGLGEQMARAKELNKDNWEWRAYYGMPGWPRHELTALDRSRIEYAVGHSPANFWAEWVFHGLYPSWTKLRPEEEERLLLDTTRLTTDYQLTHALLAYLWMKRSDPAVAAQRNVDRLIGQVSTRLYRSQTWDPCTSDLYNERLAFWLYMDEPPPLKQRWIERLILSQNADGGWTFDRSVLRTLGQFVGYDRGPGKSSPHATFLALYALAEYDACH